MKVVGSPAVAPRYASRVVRPLGDIKDSTNIINLEHKGSLNIAMPKIKMRRTLRLVNLALMELTKGFSDITMAPSLRSKNLGRKASFTVRDA